MFVGAALLGMHMAMTHSITVSMIASYMPTGEVAGIGKLSGTAVSFTDFLLGKPAGNACGADSCSLHMVCGCSICCCRRCIALLLQLCSQCASRLLRNKKHMIAVAEECCSMRSVRNVLVGGF